MMKNEETESKNELHQRKIPSGVSQKLERFYISKNYKIPAIDFGNSNVIRTHNHLVRKLTLIHLAKPFLGTNHVAFI